MAICTASSVRIASLHCYPLKSAAGIALQQAQLTSTGIAFDRHWMVVTPGGRFVTQRELPQLALIRAQLLPEPAPEALVLTHAAAELRLPLLSCRSPQSTVTIWSDQSAAFDEGEQAAAWLTQRLGQPVRLVRFDATQPRLSNRRWTFDLEAFNAFSDGYPLLIIGQASLQELNSLLPQAVPMDRFRPNIVLEGLGAYDEDYIDELFGEDRHGERMRLRLVKPCTRCRITTVDQHSGEPQGAEPLRTLMEHRYDPHLRGALFGQNAIILEGTRALLERQQSLRIRWKDPPPPL